MVSIDMTEPCRSKNIRCPYCAVGLDFRLMVRQAGGDWYVCVGCGHLSLPSSPFYRCICRRCSGIDRKWSNAPIPVKLPKRSLFQVFQIRLRNLSRLFLMATYSRR